MQSDIKSYKRKAYYYETDGMRIVHHSNYIRWFEETRVYILDALGFSYSRMEDMGVMIPVLSSKCEYKYPVSFGDEFEVKMTVSEFNGVRMTVVYRVINNTSGRLSAVGETTHCFVNSDFRPLRTKRDCPEIYEFFKSHAGTEY